ncbi:hypothetical protein DERP_003855 [Dermatophagoides pteronyssinus]|uniref:Uncharacterized protein n=1 Tax=Dermatophagoides pteronyssinus TaxID=6956 RepID=A0ABQ8J7Y8_DERPT|nr:hypothetical protein DERP_003855 [Dermatophagoides pteronyssinus]
MVLFLHNPEYYLQCELINGHSLIIIDLVDQVLVRHDLKQLKLRLDEDDDDENYVHLSATN